jgi:hypothetical protein
MPKGIAKNPKLDGRLKKNRSKKAGKKIVSSPAWVGPELSSVEEAVDYGYKRLEQETDEPTTLPETDMVSHPPHYTVGGIETIDFIEAKQLGYHLGQVIKYISRAGKKGSRLEDLQKARWYLNREIALSE